MGQGKPRGIPKSFCLLFLLLVGYVVNEITSKAKSSVIEESMLILHWKNASMDKEHFELVDMETEIEVMTKAQRKYAPIDTIHKFGHLHTGVWMVILDTSMTNLENAKILMFKRSPRAVTCPNFWSLPGEHSHLDEEPEETIMRGIREELGETFYNQFLHTGGKMKPLLEHPIFFLQDYETPKGLRLDRQINSIFVIEMNTPVSVLQRLSNVDKKENTRMAWIYKSELHSWLDKAPDKKFCHEKNMQVFQLILDRLDYLQTQ